MTHLRSILAAIILCGLPALLSADTIMIKDAYAYRATPSSKAGGIFMMIHNHGTADDRLARVASTAARKVELHTHLKSADGVMKMRPVLDGFVIEAGKMAMLKRGADHIMLMGLRSSWHQGDLISIVLTFEKAGEMTLDVPVDLNRADAAHSH